MRRSIAVRLRQLANKLDPQPASTTVYWALAVEPYFWQRGGSTVS